MYQSTGLGHAGSTPDFVMRTGAYAVMDPINARRDVSQGFVNNWTRRSVGRQGNPPGFAQNTPSPVNVNADAPVAGFGYFGADAPATPSRHAVLATATVQTLDPKFAIWGGAGGAAVGVLGGLVAGGQGRRVKGALIGALIGAVGAVGTAALIRYNGHVSVGNPAAGMDSALTGVFWR